MRYASVCSGIESATCAWRPLGWCPVWFAEIEPFASAVLEYRWPGVPNRGDFTRIDVKPGSIDLLVGGTPCQSFSVAGQRAGLADPRGNLALEFLRLARRLRPRWLVWENVPGVLSSGGGWDLGVFLGALGECGYGFAYRILDAKHFGIPQRRRRIYVVGYPGDWTRAAEVLFERESLCGDSSPGGEAREGIAPATRNGTPFHLSRGGPRNRGITAGESELAPAMDRHGTDPVWNQGGIAVAFSPQAGGNQTRIGYAPEESTVASLIAKQTPAIVQPYNIIGMAQEGRNHAYPAEVSGCLQHKGLAATGNEAGTLIHHRTAIRRLTPMECERLQGFEDDYTMIPWKGRPAEDCPDGPRYKSIGNSMAVPVMRWIGERIRRVEARI